MTGSAERQVAIVADTSLQRHILATTVRTFGYEVAITVPPERLNIEQIQRQKIGVWLVDLTDEDEWIDFIELLVEHAEAPVLFGDAYSPQPETPAYKRWEKRLYQKLFKQIGAPETSASISSATVSPIPEPKPLAAISLPRSCSDAQSSETVGLVERVWVLGASLGGPAAVKEFLSFLPAGLPVAFVLAQHIDGGFQKILAQVLSRNTHFNICEHCVNQKIEYGNVYVAPVEHEVVFSNAGRVMAVEKQWDGPYAPSIDQVIMNVAARYGRNSGALIFSGMGNDGASGAPEMHKKGGVIWAQNADSCANSSMPDSVRETGCVTYSGAPQQLAYQLVDSIRRQVGNTEYQLNVNEVE
ncbi:MAG: chemotaxis protein CheB [Gammaproteobacteria bacterium]|nr:MAG: chemotaxis protein CheB [Gammaproteobacteria bacterium]